MKLFKQISLVVLVKFIILLAVGLVAQRLIPYLGNFSFPEVLTAYNLPEPVKAFANFDGIQYLFIVQSGYNDFSYAFFPLYPLLIKIVGQLFLGNYLLAAVLISQLSLIGAMWLAYQWLRSFFSAQQVRWFLIFWLVFPTAFFLQAAYTESLFLLWIFATLFCLQKKNIWWAGLFSLLAALTRVTGVFLVIPLALYYWPTWKKPQSLVVIFPIIGLSIYMLFLWRSVGDPLAFFHAQSAFGAGRSTQLVLLPQVYFRYLKILFLSDQNFNYGVAVLELVAFTTAFLTAGWESWQNFKRQKWPLLSVGLFSLAILLLPTLTGTFLSLPRFALTSLASFIWLSRLNNNAAKLCLVIFFAILQVALWAYFVQGYFIS